MNVHQIDQFGIDNLQLVEQDMPRPGPDQVLVRMRSVSLNYRDLMVVNGAYNPRMKLPAVPFSDGAGEVVETGSGSTRWNVGDRVCSTVIPGWIDGGPTAAKAKTAIGAGGMTGVMREYAVFDENAIVAAPPHLSFAEAATLPCAALTAWHGLVVSGGLKPGESVLTLGTGGVSIFAVQFAKALGARVISTSSSDQKIAKLKALGADETVNYVDVPDWDKRVLELTDGIGVDHVIEVGGTGTLARSVKVARTGGHIALIGALDMNGEFNPIPVFMKGIRMQGIFVGSRAMFEEMNAFISKENIKPVIDKTFPLEAVKDALHYLESGSHFGKVVVEF